MSDILYIASESKGRRKLLERCGFKFETLRHEADECIANKPKLFSEYVLAIARQKMDHVILPENEAVTDKPLFVVTGDTLFKTGDDEAIGKPADVEDAKRMLRMIAKSSIDLITGCVVEKKVYDNGWKTLDKREFLVNVQVEYIVPEEWMDKYLEMVPDAMLCCGAATVEGFGDNFLKSINGSYSSAVGLPIFELREALTDMGFTL